MSVILDTNILISSLIKNSTSRKIIMLSGLDFHYPKASLMEVDKYKNLILKKSKMNEKEYNSLLLIILSYIRLIEQREIEKFLGKADKIIGRIDKKDVIFIAGALAIKNSIVWTEDKHFKQQTEIKTYSTGELIREFDLDFIVG